MRSNTKDNISIIKMTMIEYNQSMNVDKFMNCSFYTQNISSNYMSSKMSGSGSKGQFIFSDDYIVLY